MLRQDLTRLIVGIALSAFAAQAYGYTSSASDDPIEASARVALAARLAELRPDIERFDIEILPASRRRGESEAQIEASEVLSVGARSSVRILYVQDSSRRTRTLWFAVTGVRAVHVATRDLPPLSALTEADVALTERDVMSHSCAPIETVEALNDLRTKRALRSGDVLCRDFLERRPPVARGQAVTVHYASERIALTSKGIARHDAQIGQRLAVVNPASQETFYAMVIADNEVRLYEH